MNINGFLRRNGCAIVLVGSFSGCSGLVLYPAFQSASTSAWRSNCQANLKLIALACQEYRADYDGNYPPLSDGNKRGWAQILQAREPALQFSCPASYKSSFSPSSDYFFNARLASRQQDLVRDPTSTVSFGDGVDNGPTNSHYWELPNDSGNENSPLQRHYGRANYAFADGHVKSLTPKALSEWWENDGDHKEWHYKFSPDDSASRVVPRKKVVYPTADAQTKRLHDLVDAARSFDKTN